MAKMNSRIARGRIADKVVLRLWGMTAGRCEMCNEILYLNSTFGTPGNYAQNAHICGVGVSGPRHKDEMSQEEINMIENLMLLCPTCHKMIDDTPDYYSEGQLVRRKKEHESRVRRVTEISKDQSCRIVTYFTNLDSQREIFNERLFKEALISSEKVPLQESPIELHESTDTLFVGSVESFADKAEALKRNFHHMFGRINDMESVGIFALAPQSLLVLLGTLLNDQYNAMVYQCHREGHKWAWKDEDTTPTFIVKTPSEGLTGHVALVVDLSAEVVDNRIISVLGGDTAIYHLTLNEPNRDFVTNRNVQAAFIETFRKLMEDVKNSAAVPEMIHLFPVMPCSLAVRLGMDYMPKADLPLIIYEQASAQEGFFAAIKIGGLE